MMSTYVICISTEKNETMVCRLYNERRSNQITGTKLSVLYKINQESTNKSPCLEMGRQNV